MDRGVTRVDERKGPVVFAPISESSSTEVPEGFAQTRPDVAGVSVHPSRVPVVDIDGREEERGSEWPRLSGPRCQELENSGVAFREPARETGSSARGD